MGKYTIDQLCEQTGLSRRTIRFYVQQGVIDPPAGRGRGGFYDSGHLARLLKIRDLQKKGLTLEAIATILSGKKPAGEPAVHSRLPHLSNSQPAGRSVVALYELAPGIVLQVNRDAEEAEGRLVRNIVNYARLIAKEGKGELK
ncbi:MAG: MerR family transcriptional regulator [Elusimicrobiota bacterium]|nr:MerR family transcriptional regulator [Elusimicrobiota bacterium]